MPAFEGSDLFASPPLKMNLEPRGKTTNGLFSEPVEEKECNSPAPGKQGLDFNLFYDFRHLGCIFIVF